MASPGQELGPTPCPPSLPLPRWPCNTRAGVARITNDGAPSLQRAGRHPMPDFAPTRESHGDLESRHHRRPPGTAQAASSSPGQGLSPSPAGGLTDSQNRPGAPGRPKGTERRQKTESKERVPLKVCMYACSHSILPSCGLSLHESRSRSWKDFR